VKRTLLVVALTLICIAPSFAYNLGGAVAVPVDDFGWGIVVPPSAGEAGAPVMLWAIPGDDWVGSRAWGRATTIVGRLAAWEPALQDVAAIGQIYAAKTVGDEDWCVCVSGFDGNSWRKVELVSVDKATAKAYGACAKQLATFWAARLKALAMVNHGAGPWGAMIPKPWLNTLMTNWRDWKSIKGINDWTGKYAPEFGWY